MKNIRFNQSENAYFVVNLITQRKILFVLFYLEEKEKSVPQYDKSNT